MQQSSKQGGGGWLAPAELMQRRCHVRVGDESVLRQALGRDQKVVGSQGLSGWEVLGWWGG